MYVYIYTYNQCIYIYISIIINSGCGIRRELGTSGRSGLRFAVKGTHEHHAECRVCAELNLDILHQLLEGLLLQHGSQPLVLFRQQLASDPEAFHSAVLRESTTNRQHASIWKLSVFSWNGLDFSRRSLGQHRADKKLGYRTVPLVRFVEPGYLSVSTQRSLGSRGIQEKCASRIWQFRKIRRVLFWRPYMRDPLVLFQRAPNFQQFRYLVPPSLWYLTPLGSESICLCEC